MIKQIKLLKNFLNQFLFRYQIGLEESMKGNDFSFDYIHLLYFRCYKINLNRGGSYIHCPDWIKN